MTNPEMDLVLWLQVISLKHLEVTYLTVQQPPCFIMGLIKD